MAKPKNDFTSIGNLYGGMLNGVKHKLVSEGKIGPKVGEIGESPLIKGGPQTTAGYMPAKLDKKTMSKKDIDDNLYNVNNLTQDEDEENTAKPSKTTKKRVKIAKESINNFMRKKSIFDTLYENVMSPSSALGPNTGTQSGPEMDDSQELDALGIDSDEGVDEETVTFTLDRATAEKLLDVIGAAMGDSGGEEFEDDGDEMDSEGDYDTSEEAEEGFWDEDEEDEAVAGSKSIDMGKKNKVGNLKVSSGAASAAVTDKVGNDGDHGHALHGAKVPNMGKNNKVSNLKTGSKSMFER